MKKYEIEIMEIARMALDLNAVREDISDDLDLSDDEITKIRAYLEYKLNRENSDTVIKELKDIHGNCDTD